MTTPWYRTWHGLAVAAAYALFTVGAMLVSTGGLFDSTATFADTSSLATTQVPVYVYVYAFLGAMTYAFTSIVATFERGTAGVFRVGVRAMAALPLAAGVFLLSDALGFDVAGGHLGAGLAFLVGLYVNLALKALGGLADRLYGGVRTMTGGSDESTESDRTR